MDIKIFKQKLFDEAKKQGFSECEIYYSVSKRVGLNILKGEIEKFINETDGGLSFRGIYGENMGYSYIEKIDESMIESLIIKAKENAEIMDNEEKEEIFRGSKKYFEVKKYYEEIEKITTEDMVNKALELEKTILKYDKKIQSCNCCSASKSYGEIYMANTKGMELTEKGNSMIFYASSVAKDKDSVQSSGDGEIYYSKDDINVKKLGENIAKKSLAFLGAKSMLTKKYDIVFENECFTSLLSCYTNIFYGETAQKGFSLLKDKLNEKIASDKITIIDDPLMEKGYGSRGFDAEGVATFRKTIIEKGILKTYLHNLKSAKKDGVASTGNASKWGYKGGIGISYTNFYVQKGEKSLNEMLKNIEEGIYITELSGLHCGVDSISGDFSLLSSGFAIKNGKIGQPVEQITVAGNFYEMLKNIKDIGNDIKFALNGIGSPSIFAGKLSVSGE